MRSALPSARGFSLVELLVVASVLALLIALVASALGPARAAATDAACVANLRQCFTISAAFALDHDGLGPAIGQPYASVPNWALVVQQASGAGGAPSYRQHSALVCPGAERALGPGMTRTYAMNGTGHYRQPWNADPDNYDDPVAPGATHVGVRIHRVENPSGAALLIDADRNPQQPIADRCASVLDFRPEANMADRIGRWHAGQADRVFQAAMFDGATARFPEPPASFLEPLP